MSNTERNWLIRTSQNQILGPVAKAKVVEFIQKGALGLTDEVTSGNGYWFHLREKDLVEKYLFGDVPQSYNPISEAKTVLARRENPDKTTSINASPANVTQVLNIKNLDLTQVVPKNEDLEFPDITLVQKVSANDFKDSDTKLPTNDDLEFPDVDSIRSNSNSQVTLTKIEMPSAVAQSVEMTTPVSSHHASEKTKETKTSGVNEINISLEEVKLPDNSDLEYPDMDFIDSAKKKADDEIEVKFDVPKAAPKKNKPNLEVSDADIKLELIAPEIVKETKASPEADVKPLSVVTREAPKTLLAERKTRSAKKEDTNPKMPKNPAQAREMAPELKNRNDSYLFIILIVLVVLILGIVFYYYRFILNKPLPV